MSAFTLLSDFGTKDNYVSAIKVTLGKHVHYNKIIDISHSVGNSDIRHAAYLTLSTHKHFPAGTIHLILVGVFAQTRQKLIISECNGHYFLAPDNGILPLALKNDLQNTFFCHEFGESATLSDWMAEIVKVATIILSGGNPADHYNLYEPKQVYITAEPIIHSNRVDCSILHIDRYGNIVININRDQFDSVTSNHKFSIKILGVREEITKISQHYNDVATGKYLCRFNSSGFLEIAVNRSPGNEPEAKVTELPVINYDRISINLQ